MAPDEDLDPDEPDSISDPSDEWAVAVSHDDIRSIKGALATIIDAVGMNSGQSRAIKTLIYRTLYRWFDDLAAEARRRPEGSVRSIIELTEPDVVPTSYPVIVFREGADEDMRGVGDEGDHDSVLICLDQGPQGEVLERFWRGSFQPLDHNQFRSRRENLIWNAMRSALLEASPFQVSAPERTSPAEWIDFPPQPPV